MAVFYGPTGRFPVRDGLIGFWDANIYRSYPGSGTTWNDLSGRNATGTLYNGPTYSSGAVSFDGTNDYFATSSVPGLNTSAITHCCLFSVSSLPPGFICPFGGSLSLINGIKAYASGSNIILSTQYNISSSNFGSNLFSGSLNTWYFITACWTSGGTVKMYRNDTLHSQSSVATGTLNNYSTSHTMAIYSTTEYAAVSISMAAVYDRELTASEIATNYNTFKGRYNV